MTGDTGTRSARRSLLLFDPSGTAHSANVVLGLSRAAAARGVDVVVHAPRLDGVEAPTGATWKPVSIPTMADRAGRRAFRQALRDALDACDDVLCDLNLDRSVRSRARALPVCDRDVFVLHQLNMVAPPPGPTARERRQVRRSRGRVRVLRSIAARGAPVLVTSELVRDRVAELVPAHQLHVAPWPVVDAEAACLAPDWQPPRDGTRTILFAGSARRAKGLDVLLTAAKDVHGFDRLVVPGTVPDVIRRELDLTDPRVELWNRFLGPDEYGTTLASAALVALPYRRAYLDRGISSSVLAEALAYGRPLVVSEALARLLPPDYEGVVVADAEDPAAFAVGIRTALARLDELERIAMDAGRAFVRRHHTYQRYVDQVFAAAGRPLAPERAVGP